jgi:hypothetical protein
MHLSRRALHWSIALVLLGNLALIATWPLLRDSATRSLVAPVYAGLCHQLPDRCYQVGGEAMPVCARCLGVWLGLFLGAALVGLPRRPAVAVGLLGWLVVSWLVGPLLPASWHVERALAGLAGGLGAYVLACALPARLKWMTRGLMRWSGRRRVRGSPGRTASPSASGASRGRAGAGAIRQLRADGPRRRPPSRPPVR